MAMSSASHRDHDDQRLSSISNASAPRSAGPPFDDLDADLVIQSHDLIEFRVHRYLLQLVSPVFKDMLSMPQPLASRTRSASSRNESVKLPESSCTLRLLLSYCDPRIPNPDVDGLTLDQVSEVLDSGIKYQMECIKNDIIPKLQISVVHIRENPLHVYAIGVKIHLLGAVGGRAVAKIAAVELLKHKVPFTLSLKGLEPCPQNIWKNFTFGIHGAEIGYWTDWKTQTNGVDDLGFGCMKKRNANAIESIESSSWD
jgi:hypothetical protein